MPNPAGNFPSAPPVYFDQGAGAKLLQPQNQVPFQAIAGPSVAEVTALRDALIAAGIMAAS